MSYNAHRKPSTVIGAASSASALHTTAPPPPDVWHDVCACALEDFVEVPPAIGGSVPRRGVLRYVGPVDFADGLWAGVELVGTLGRNDGSVKGHKYFPCLPGQGLFVRPDTVMPFMSDTPVEVNNNNNNANAEELATLRKSLDTALGRNIELEMEIDDLNAQLARAQHDAVAGVDKVPAVSFSSPPPIPITAAPHPPPAEPLPVSERIQLEMEAMELKDDLDAAKRALRTAEATIAQLRKSAATTTGIGSAPAATAAAVTSDAALVAARAQLKEKQAECAQLLASLEEARAETTELAHRLSSATAASTHPSPSEREAQLEERMRALEADKARLAADAETLWGEAAEADAVAAAKLAAMEATVRDCQTAREKLETAHGEATRQVAALTAQLQQQAEVHAADAITAESAALRSQQEWEKKLEAVEAGKHELQELLELTEQELLEEKKQTDQLSEVVTRLRDEARARIDTGQDQLAALEVQNQRQSQDLLQAQREAKHLQAQLDAALADSRAALSEAGPSRARNSSDAAVAAPAPSAELDALKLRVFQLQKEKEVDAQLRLRFDALSKELAGVRLEGRQQLESARAAQENVRAEWAQKCGALQQEVDALREAARAAEAHDADGDRHAAAATTAEASSLDALERRSYQRVLVRSLQPYATLVAAPHGARPGEGVEAVALASVTAHCRAGAADDGAASSLASSSRSASHSSVVDRMALYSEALRQWREKEAEAGCVGGVLDFTTSEARAHSVKALFSA